MYKLEYVRCKRCEKTGKHSYSSQSAATRAINKYADIKRAYKCVSCNGWHTTKIGIGLAIRENLIDPIKNKGVSTEEIKNRLKVLTPVKKKVKDEW